MRVPALDLSVLGRLCLALLAGTGAASCVYDFPSEPKDLQQGDITGLIKGIPPQEVSASLKPLRGARVQLKGSPVRISTRENGRFIVRNLPEGEHRLRMYFDADRDGTPEQLLAMTVGMHTPSGESRRPIVNVGTVELLKEARVQGTVALANLSPGDLSLAWTVVEDEDLVVPVDATGAFQVGGLGQGTWHLRAAWGNCVSDPVEVDVKADQTLVLAEAVKVSCGAAGETGSVQGRVQVPPDWAGDLPQGTVVLQPLGGGTQTYSTALNYPDFFFQAVPVGLYVLDFYDSTGAFNPLHRVGVVVTATGAKDAYVEPMLLSAVSGGCTDLDNDGLCAVPPESTCWESCRTVADADLDLPCVDGDQQYDCDDDADNQADPLEVACACGVAGTQQPTDCRNDPYRFDRNGGFICDPWDPEAHCPADRPHCHSPASDGGVTEDGGGDAGTPDAALTDPDGGSATDGAVGGTDAALPADAAVAGTDAALPADAAVAGTDAALPADAAVFIPDAAVQPPADASVFIPDAAVQPPADASVFIPDAAVSTRDGSVVPPPQWVVKVLATEVGDAGMPAGVVGSVMTVLPDGRVVVAGTTSGSAHFGGACPDITVPAVQTSLAEMFVAVVHKELGCQKLIRVTMNDGLNDRLPRPLGMTVEPTSGTLFVVGTSFSDSGTLRATVDGVPVGTATGDTSPDTIRFAWNFLLRIPLSGSGATALMRMPNEATQDVQDTRGGHAAPRLRMLPSGDVLVTTVLDASTPTSMTLGNALLDPAGVLPHPLLVAAVSNDLTAVSWSYLVGPGKNLNHLPAVHVSAQGDVSVAGVHSMTSQANAGAPAAPLILNTAAAQSVYVFRRGVDGIATLGALPLEWTGPVDQTDVFLQLGALDVDAAGTLTVAGTVFNLNVLSAAQLRLPSGETVDPVASVREFAVKVPTTRDTAALVATVSGPSDTGAVSNRMELANGHLRVQGTTRGALLVTTAGNSGLSVQAPAPKQFMDYYVDINLVDFTVAGVMGDVLSQYRATLDFGVFPDSSVAVLGWTGAGMLFGTKSACGVVVPPAVPVTGSPVDQQRFLAFMPKEALTQGCTTTAGGLTDPEGTRASPVFLGPVQPGTSTTKALSLRNYNDVDCLRFQTDATCTNLARVGVKPTVGGGCSPSAGFILFDSATPATLYGSQTSYGVTSCPVEVWGLQPSKEYELCFWSLPGTEMALNVDLLLTCY